MGLTFSLSGEYWPQCGSYCTCFTIVHCDKPYNKVKQKTKHKNKNRMGGNSTVNVTVKETVKRFLGHKGSKFFFLC